jgi:copper resistance protein D
VIGVFAAVRAIHLASLMVAFGASAYLVLLRRELGIEIPVQLGLRAASLLALVSAALWLLLVAGQMSGDWRNAADPGTVILVANGTRFGHIWMGRIGGLILLDIGCFIWNPTRQPAWTLLAGLLLASLGLTSHAAAGSGGLGFVRAVNDGVHLLTAGFWLGALLVLAVLARRHRRESSKLYAPFRLFSLWGTYTVAILVVTGLVNVASILPAHAVSLRNVYVDLLATKISFALAMIGLAAVNRSLLLPGLHNGEAMASRQMGYNLAAEIVLGATVVAIVGYLGMTAP